METQWFVNQQCGMRGPLSWRLCRSIGSAGEQADRVPACRQAGKALERGALFYQSRAGGILFDKVLALL